MADTLRPLWRLDDFAPMYSAWLKIEKPSDELQKIVLLWLAARADDPYRGGLRRDSENPYMYSGPIPGTKGPDGRVVCCTYFIHAEDRSVQCSMLVNLSPPFL